MVQGGGDKLKNSNPTDGNQFTVNNSVKSIFKPFLIIGGGGNRFHF
jgi:hypothetical protein